MNSLSKLLFLGFEKLIFSDFWGPQEIQPWAKSAQILDSLPLSALNYLINKPDGISEQAEIFVSNER